MYYLVFTSHHDRPYPCKIAFIARDFLLWECRVERYADDSPYIAEIRAREERGNPKEMRRVDLVEIWAREVVGRTRRDGRLVQQLAMSDEHLPEECRRYARASSLVQDFIWGLVAFDKPGSKHNSPPVDPRPLPESPHALVSTYLRLLRRFQHTMNVTLPRESNGDLVVADEVVMEFRLHESLKLAYLAHAVMVATGKGRMGSVERDKSTGFTKVTLFVEVSDCMMQQYDDAETRDPVPLYERVEYPPPYVPA